MVKVLFIDDDPQAHRTLDMVLPEPYVLISAYTARQGIEAVAHESADVVLLDINLPDLDGIAALKAIVARPLPPPVVMLTALTDPRLVKEAILAGACDYIVKPYELKELLGTLRTVVSGADARRAAASAAGRALLESLIGESACIHEVKQLILRYAPSDSPVLILGESGTGKELVARSIHEASRRRGGPALPSTAARCRKRFWRPSCSARRKARSPTPCAARAASSRPTAARFSWTRSEKCPRQRRPGFFGSSNRRS